MVIVYEVAKNAHVHEGVRKNSTKPHLYKKVKYVSSNHKNGTEVLSRVNQKGEIKSTVWGGLKNGKPKASSLEEAKQMQKEMDARNRKRRSDENKEYQKRKDKAGPGKRVKLSARKGHLLP